MTLNEHAPIPGLTAASLTRLNIEAPRLIREALSAGRRLVGLVLHVEPDAVTLESRVYPVSATGSRQVRDRFEGNPSRDSRENFDACN